MESKKTYYLVDFENVGVNGIEGAEGLREEDHICLFSTRNAQKISTAVLSGFNTAVLRSYEIPARSQAVDMHLVSFLGYLIGSEGTSARYIIVSNDTDYDDVIRFWSGRSGAEICRVGSIGPGKKKTIVTRKVPVRRSQPQPAEEQQGKASAATEKQREKAPAETEKRQGNPSTAKEKRQGNPSAAKEKQQGKTPTAAERQQGKTSAAAERKPSPSQKPKKLELSSRVRQAVGEAGFDGAAPGRAAEIVSAHYGKQEMLQFIHNDLQAAFGDPSYRLVYEAVKRAVAGDPGTQAREGDKPSSVVRRPSSVTQVNSSVQKLLSQADYENEVVTGVASLVSRHFGREGGKQSVYQAVTAKYGQQRGRKIYRQIRGLL